MAIAAKVIQQPVSSQAERQEGIRELPGSHIVCEALMREGVELLFGYPGGAIMPFYDSLTSYPSLHHVLTRHEQGAAHAADGYARATGKVGVCVATSGPGATNLVTGLATAFMDSTPIVAITGQVARQFIGRDAFQETDILGVTQPITKHNFLVRSTDEIAAVVHEAFRIARSGRPGPVLIDIPKDVQQLKASYDPSAHVTSDEYLHSNYANIPQPTETALTQAAQLIAQAQRPLIMAGHGVILSNAYAELKAFAEKTSIPVITTLLGLSAFPETHPLYLGMPGMHGPAYVNQAIGQADLIIGVGLRFDDRVTGKVDGFAPNAQFIHIDIDASEMHKVKVAAVPIVSDAKIALAALTEKVEPTDKATWRNELSTWQADDEARQRQIGRDTTFPDPIGILTAIREETGGEAIVVSDVGQNQMWTARHYTWTRPNSHITSGGLGTMGFALPAAMGVKFGMPDAPVWVVAGDGGIQMNIQELATLQQEGIALKIAIMNNGYLGMVRQWQQFFHSRNYSETPITGPDYVKLADAYGVTGIRVTSGEDVAATIKRAMETEGTVIIDFVIASESNVYPMVAPGSAITSMIHEKAEGMPEMTDTMTTTERSGQSNLPQGVEQTYTLIVLVEDRPGAVDRVVGLMRRRRANMQTLVLGRGEEPTLVRLTFAVTDSEVALEHLVAQLRKIVDVRQVTNLTSQQVVARELALIKVSSTPENWHEIVEHGHLFGAHAIDIAPETVTLEVTGSAEKIEKLVAVLQAYGIREIARSGRVVIARGAGEVLGTL